MTSMGNGKLIEKHLKSRDNPHGCGFVMEIQLLTIVVCLLSLARSVDRSNFKTCDQSSFCK